MLGARLEQEGNGALAAEARLCYVCSGNLERLVECWAKGHQAPSPMALQVSPALQDSSPCKRLEVGPCRNIDTGEGEQERPDFMFRTFSQGSVGTSFSLPQPEEMV